MTHISSTKLGVKRKSYTHDLSFDNNTTMDFGFMQPLLCQLLEPKSKVSLSAKQLVRLAPMPTPSFARMYLQNYANFVKMTDVVPYYEALLARMTYRGSNGSSYRPTSMPVISNKILCSFVLSFSDMSAYKKQADGSYVPAPSSDAAESELNSFLFGSSWQGDTFSVTNITGTPITPLNADYVVQTSNFVCCFRYSLAAMRLRKQFIGLGYGLNIMDNHSVSLAPLLAYYKAYFDRFGLTRNYSFLDTSCFELIRLIEDYNYNFVAAYETSTSSSSYTYMRRAFTGFISDLKEMFYTQADDILSVHRQNPNNTVATGSLGFPSQGSANSVSLPDPTKYNDEQILSLFPSLEPNVNISDSFTSLDNVSLEYLKRLSSYVSKDSAIGKRLSDWVRVHYGVDVSNSLFEDTFNVSAWRTNISIDDIFSTSDTADIANKDKGEFLGAYAGKGIGFSNDHFTFSSPCAGFLFVMSCIVPKAGIFLGNDPSLYAINWDTIPHPEFDALGFELTPLSCFISDNAVCSFQDKTSYTNGSFGYVPRYTGFKFKKNVVNGDMYTGYFKRDLQPYFNDRIITNNFLSVTGDSNKLGFSVQPNSAPLASTSWQRLCAYGFLSDFNRLFYNNPSLGKTNSQDADTVIFEDLDNFIVQTVFDFKVSNWMLPISMSYDTVSDDDNNTVSISNN